MGYTHESTFEKMGDALKGALPQHASEFERRAEFVRGYCEQRGWNPSSVTIDQLLEIRRQDGWRNP